MSLGRKISVQTFVVLLRGINVGSTRKVPMADLRATCLKLRWQRPETYIQSGNLIVEACGDAQQVRRALEPELAARFGFAVDVVVRAAPKWKTYVAANPFASDAAALGKMVHLYLSRDPLASRATDVLKNAPMSANASTLPARRSGSTTASPVSLVPNSRPPCSTKHADHPRQAAT